MYKSQFRKIMTGFVLPGPFHIMAFAQIIHLPSLLMTSLDFSRKISNMRSVSPAPESSCVSMRSDVSMDPPTNFRSGDSSAKQR